MASKIFDTLLDIGSWLFLPIAPLQWLANETNATPKANKSTLTKNLVEKPLLALIGQPYYSKYIGALDKKYVDAWEIYLVDKWGIDEGASEKLAELVVLFAKNNLAPVITSGYRSTEKQQELYDRWLRGDKSVFTPAKPGTSPHERTNWLGRPAARCLDVAINNYQSGAIIAKELGLSSGYPADPVHFGDLSIT